MLSCLAAAPAKIQVTCLNFHTCDPDSDERRYARLAAARAGCELVELERAPYVALERIYECEPTVGPVNVVMRGLEVQPLVAQLAQARTPQWWCAAMAGILCFFGGGHSWRSWTLRAVEGCGRN